MSRAQPKNYLPSAVPGWRQALRLLHYDYASALAQLRKTASEHAERSGIAFPIGTCFLHRARGCAPACQRCRCCLPGLPVGWIPTREPVFYDDVSNLAQPKETASELTVFECRLHHWHVFLHRARGCAPARQRCKRIQHPLSRGGHHHWRVLRALNAQVRHTMSKGGVGSGQCQNALSTYCVLNAAPARSGLHCKCAVHLLCACACLKRECEETRAPAKPVHVTSARPCAFCARQSVVCGVGNNEARAAACGWPASTRLLKCGACRVGTERWFGLG